MSYNFKIEMETYGDITDKISSFRITDGILQYAREMTLSIADPIFYDSLDFSTITEDPEITIYTQISDSWVQQGQFFIERPQLMYTKDNERMPSVWGRSMTAKLGAPFASKVNKIWDDTNFYTIMEEMCDLAGLTWDENLCEPENYKIYAHSYRAEFLYPIEIMSELASFIGGLVVTDKDDNIRVVNYQYTPTGPLWTVTDDEIQSLSEKPEWPTFGNRIRICPMGSLAGYAVYMYFPDGNCLPVDDTIKLKLVVQVINAEGQGVNSEIVDWSHDGTYATFTRGAATTTQDILISNEFTEATGMNTFELQFIPDEILSVYKSTDAGKVTNVADGGYTISGRTVTLVDDFDFCDELIYVDYIASGATVNFIRAGSTAEDIQVTASVQGEDARGDVYIGNSCECPMEITITAAPFEIYKGQVSHLLVYAEDSGGPINIRRTVYMSTGVANDRKGKLEWEVGQLSEVRIQYEKTQIRNDVPGNSQIELSMFPLASSGSRGGIYVYRNDGNDAITGSNLYSSRDGKVITLNTKLSTGDDILVDYEAVGAAFNRFYGHNKGSEQVIALVNGNRRDPFSATLTMDIRDPEDCMPEENMAESTQPQLWTVPAYTTGTPAVTIADLKRDGKAVGGSTATAKFVGKQWDPVDDPDDSWEDTAAPDWPTVTYTVPRVFNPNRNAGCSINDTQCTANFFCCKNNDVYGCNLYAQCTSVADECCSYAKLLADPTDAAALAARFAEAVAAGCECDNMCHMEILKFGTTQDYDGGSMRTIAQIVIEDYGYAQGTIDYQNKHTELLAEALAACTTQCNQQNPETCSGTISYTSLYMEGGEGQTLTVTAPIEDTTRYTWEILSGTGSLDVAVGDTVVYTAPVTNVNCEDNPTIALKCDDVIMDSITMTVNIELANYEAYRYYFCTVWECTGGLCSKIEYQKYNCSDELFSQSFWACDACSNNPICTCQFLFDRCSDPARCVVADCDGAIYDVRTAGLKAAGCCPLALL